jgi:hypothetical protein
LLAGAAAGLPTPVPAVPLGSATAAVPGKFLPASLIAAGPGRLLALLRCRDGHAKQHILNIYQIKESFCYFENQ